jgi:hypothetical protein
MDTLVKALEQHGHGVAISSDYRRDTVVTVNAEPLALRLRERSLRSAHVMTADEQKRFLKDGYEPYTKYDYCPTGELRLSVIRLDYRHTETGWSDGKRKKLEQQVGTIVVGLEALVERIHQERLEREEAHQRWEEAARQREEERRRREDEAKRFEQLRKDAAHWREARLLRRYVRAVEAAVPTDQRGPDFEKWLAWAREAVERLDPMRNSGGSAQAAASASQPAYAPAPDGNPMGQRPPARS